jgi:hypothetical protein
MAFVWSDGFDCYATGADATTGYWDTTVASSLNLVAGRFAGSQAFSWNGTASQTLAKTSSVNDAVHHINVAFRQTFAISGSNLGLYLQLLDGATAQCSIVFRTDGAILLTAGAANGTVLATYTGAFPVVNTWYSFEIEVVISNTAGWMKVRKNGNTTEDFTSSLTLDTQASANPYANKLQIAQQVGVATQNLDDLYWRSTFDASTAVWMGDMRCITRYPASDASVQFSRTPLSYFAQRSSNTASTGALSANNVRAVDVVAPATGALSSLTLNFSVGITGHARMALYDATGVGGGAGALLAQSAELTNPGAGVNTFPVTAGPVVTKGVTYWVAMWSDVSVTGVSSGTPVTADLVPATYTTTFPATMAGFTTPSVVGIASAGMNVVLSSNYQLVSEAQQDATTSYVYDSVPGHADLYGIAPIASTPLTTFAVTTRAYMIKSDAGTRTAAVQLKSGGTTDASPTVVLTPSNWQWAWKHYTSDPAGGAWSAAAVNTCTVGPVIVA